MNELRALLSSLENQFKESIEGQYAKLYEESEIATQDMSVINELDEYINSVASFKTNCTECKNSSDNYNYSNTVESLSDIINSIDGYVIICNNVIEDIKTASKEAFEEALQKFKTMESAYNNLIDKANEYYNNASKYRRIRNNYDDGSDERAKYDRYYENNKRSCRTYINKATEKFNQLSQFISSEGIKKASVGSGVAQEENLLENGVSNLNIIKYEGGISREFNYSEDGNLETVTTTNDNLGKITTKYDESGLPISHTIYDNEGTAIATFEYDEKGNLKLNQETVSDRYDNHNWLFIDKNNGREYYAGIKPWGQFEITLEDNTLKYNNQYDEYNGIEGLYAYDLLGENKRIGFSTEINSEGDVISTLIDGNGACDQKMADKHGIIMDENYNKTIDSNGLETIEKNGIKYIYDTNDDSYRRTETNDYIEEENENSFYNYKREDPDGSPEGSGYNLFVRLSSGGSDISISCVEPNPEVDKENGLTSFYSYSVRDYKTKETHYFATESNWFKELEINGIKDFDGDKLQAILSNAKELDENQGQMNFLGN